MFKYLLILTLFLSPVYVIPSACAATTQEKWEEILRQEQRERERREKEQYWAQFKPVPGQKQNFGDRFLAFLSFLFWIFIAICVVFCIFKR